MQGRTRLHLAVIEEQAEVVADLISRGADIDADDASGMTPLHFAVRTRNKPIIRLLLEAGANAHASNEMFFKTDIDSPFSLAVSSNDPSLLKLFLDYESVAENLNQCNTIQCAAMWGNSKMVKLLIDAGADVNAKCSSLKSSTPLHWAVKMGNFNILQLLIDSGASLDARGSNGNTLLHTAVGADDMPVRRKSRVSSGKNGKKSTEIVASKKDCGYNKNVLISTLRILLAAGARADAFNLAGQTPLQAFIEKIWCFEKFEEKSSIEECLKLLIECSDVNLADADKKNILDRISETHRRFEISRNKWNYNFANSKRLTDLLKSSLFKIIGHVARLKRVNSPVASSVSNSISRNKEYNEHYKRCKRELKKAINTKLKNCWVKFFNLLVDDETKLVKYAGNQDLVKDFNKRVSEFPIYGAWMKINMAQGIDKRALYDGAANNLSLYLPIFNPTHLVVRETLDALDEEDWKKLNERKRFNE